MDRPETQPRFPNSIYGKTGALGAQAILKKKNKMGLKNKTAAVLQVVLLRGYKDQLVVSTKEPAHRSRRRTETHRYLHTDAQDLPPT